MHDNADYVTLDVVKDKRNGWVGTVLEVHQLQDGSQSFAYVEFAREDGVTFAFQWVEFAHLEPADAS